MTERLISSKAVVAKIIADLGLEENKIKITDWKEWIAEGLHKIGAVRQYDLKVATLKIKDYQVKLPCDVEKINFVAYSHSAHKGWIPMKKSTGQFSVMYKFDNTLPECEKDCCEMLIPDDALIPLVKNMFHYNCDRRALDKLNGDLNLRQTLSALLNQYTVGCGKNFANGLDFSNTVQYDIKPGYLVTNIRDGYIKLSYYSTYLDEDGMPMIPDLPSYQEALYWYVTMKILYIEYFKGNKPQNLYYDAKSAWCFYRKQAYAEAMLPDQNDMINISNSWHTLVPEIESDDTYLSTTGDEQIIYNQNSIWK